MNLILCKFANDFVTNIEKEYKSPMKGAFRQLLHINQKIIF